MPTWLHHCAQAALSGHGVQRSFEEAPNCNSVRAFVKKKKKTFEVGSNEVHASCPSLPWFFFFFFWNICSVQTRQCYETCQLGDYRIPAGTFIQIDVEAVHQNPEFWGPEDPKLFVPERCVNFCSKIGPSPESKPMIQWCVHACACAWRVQQRAIDSLSTKRNLQRKLKPNVTQLWKPIQYRNCHTLISHWMRNLGYVPFEFALQFTFGA